VARDAVVAGQASHCAAAILVHGDRDKRCVGTLGRFHSTHDG